VPIFGHVPRIALEVNGRNVGNLGRIGTAAAIALLALAIYFAGLSSDRFSDHPLILLTLPLALAAIAFGRKGGFAAGVIASTLATVWWMQDAGPGGMAWLGARALTYLMIGVVLGWVVDSRQRLVRKLAHHNALSLDLIATASFDGYFTQVNPAFTRTLGYSPEELMRQPLLDFVHPDDRAATLDAIHEQTKEGREVFHFRNRYRTKDGAYRWLEWTSRADTEADELVAVARDITERKRLEEIEQEHTELLEQAVRDRTEELQKRNSELEGARRETLHRLALAAEYRDDETHEHTQRIGRAATLLAARLGWSKADIDVLGDAAPLHDVGKLAVSDSVLLKPGKLTANEFEHVQRHAEIGAALLSGSDFQVLQVAEEIARAHHEWWDGSGYPLGLEGDEIPLAARIVAVVDVFDALTHRRPYKSAWPVPAAVAEIHRLRGVQFDPRVVDAFDELDPFALVDLTVDRSARLHVVAVA
jgi:PAS domain S-box-containing protein